jgi:hypothetical protein
MAGSFKKIEEVQAMKIIITPLEIKPGCLLKTGRSL